MVRHEKVFCIKCEKRLDNIVLGFQWIERDSQEYKTGYMCERCNAKR